MICSFVNLLRFPSPSLKKKTYLKMRMLQGSRSGWNASARPRKVTILRCGRNHLMVYEFHRRLYSLVVLARASRVEFGQAT